MRYFILAGEASGDKQAALLCKSIFAEDPGAVIHGWGGEDMQHAGVVINKHYRDLAYMGFVEVVRHLPDILRNFKTAKKEIAAFKPDALILVDYPGFNLRMASWAHKTGHHTYYYISPQLWAWHTSRVHALKKAVRKIYVILPFEKAFYAKFDVDAMYIGHPLAMAIQQESIKDVDPKPHQIALLPGSRRNEVKLVLPEMIRLAKLMPSYQFVIMRVQHLPLSMYAEIIGGQENVTISDQSMAHVLRESKTAIVTSGTATLETALIGTPQVVVYKGNPFSYQIARRLIKVPYISLVNLIADKQLVPELIQSECTAENMVEQLNTITRPDVEIRIREGYRVLASQLTSGGGPPAAAKDIISDLGKAISK